MDLSLGFRRHELKCDRPGMQAKLQIIGAPDCALTVKDDKRVEGLCAGVPTGQERQFRLVYFAEIQTTVGGPTLDLAVALKSVDLTEQTRQELVLVFDRIDEFPNDDGDSASNLEEWCNGSNPRGS